MNELRPLFWFPHAPLFPPLITAQFDKFRGQTPGGPARAANYETDLFWAAYVTTAFEPPFQVDDDGTGLGLPVSGVTDGIERQPNSGIYFPGEISLVFVDTIRNKFRAVVQNPPFTDATQRARVTVHEVGHQFGLVSSVEFNPADPFHRPGPPTGPANMMMLDPERIPDSQFVFHVDDIASLRLRQRSPGT